MITKKRKWQKFVFNFKCHLDILMKKILKIKRGKSARLLFGQDDIYRILIIITCLVSKQAVYIRIWSLRFLDRELTQL